ncbi:hypothetical protein [Undibacterium terreum]|uniref:hypothetical protein n=1 Tax=Undibacterium terreum TaxID=1224302 RepID=UPI001669940A|nr:hypothetical protein [Undibacterium terreum]
MKNPSIDHAHHLREISAHQRLRQRRNMKMVLTYLTVASMAVASALFFSLNAVQA